MAIEQVPSDEPYWSVLASYPDMKYDQGWNFIVGSPELWHYRSQLLVPGGLVYDVGSGAYARESMQFAHLGMQVEAFEPNLKKSQALQELVDASQLPITVHADEFTAQVEKANLILMAEVFNHLDSKQAAYDLLDAAWASLKPGGHMWIRAVGKEASSYEELLWQAHHYEEITVVDEDIITHPCNCSGQTRIESSLYFDQLELSIYLA